MDLGSQDENPMGLSQIAISNLRKKIRDYNRSDMKKGRLKYCANFDQFIDQELQLHQVLLLIRDAGMNCYLCKKEVVLEYEKRYQGNQFTLDRVDNAKSHSIDNCRVCCFTCNILRMNEYTPQEFVSKFRLSESLESDASSQEAQSLSPSPKYQCRSSSGSRTPSPIPKHKCSSSSDSDALPQTKPILIRS